MNNKIIKDTAAQKDAQDLVDLSDVETRLMEQGRQKILRSRVPFKNGRPAPINGKEVLLSFGMLMDTCQTADANRALRTVNNAAAGQGFRDQDAELELALVQMEELKPQSPLEALLVSQMIAVNTAVGEVMTRAMAKDQRLDFRERNTNLATKLQRTFLQQIDSLQKLRGKGQQKVTVEHVHVHQGGQAVVGNIEKSVGRGEGKDGNP